MMRCKISIFAHSWCHDINTEVMDILFICFCYLFLKNSSCPFIISIFQSQSYEFMIFNVTALISANMSQYPYYELTCTILICRWNHRENSHLYCILFFRGFLSFAVHLDVFPSDFRKLSQYVTQKTQSPALIPQSLHFPVLFCIAFYPILSLYCHDSCRFYC